MPLIVQDKGLILFNRKLQKIAKKVQNPAGMWPLVGDEIADHVEMQFATQGAHFGRPWKPLTPEYVKWRGSAGPILVRSGAMKNTLTGRPMDIERYFGSYAEFGSNDDKAVWHQFGTHRNGKRVNPPRPMLVVTPELREGVTEVMENWLFGEM
jgi:phage gpG-like protein